MALTVRARAVAIGRLIAYALGGLLALGLYGLAIWQAPKFFVNQDVLDKATPEQRLPAEHNARLIVISIGGALVVSTGLLYTARNYRLAHRGQVTERFTKALERLGSGELYVRIGGIHALEHVMRDSPDHHSDVVEVLVAFIRDRVDRRTDESAGESSWMHPPIGTEAPALPEELASDVQAAVTALAKRPNRAERERGQINFEQLHLMGANLAKAQLRNANLAKAQLRNANLAKAQLRGAKLREAQLKKAYLGSAQLQGANLEAAQLQGANLGKAQLRGAKLAWAQLQSASLWRAQLQNANLWQAGLQGANLERAGLQGARLEGAELGGANLRGAQLQGANLAWAQLKGADLTGAQLKDTVMRGAVVTVAQLQSARDSWENYLSQPPPTTDTDQSSQGLDLH